MIPKFSAPMAKFVRTTEGQLSLAAHVVLVAAAMLPHGLSWTKTGLYIAIINGATMISRSGVKIAAINKGIGIDAPITPLGFDAARLEQIEAGIADFSAVPPESALTPDGPQPPAPADLTAVTPVS